MTSENSSAEVPAFSDQQKLSKIYLIGNAHLDPVWLWRWQEGLAEVKATYRSVLDRMNEFPNYIFTSACAAYYEWIERSEPAMFEEIRQRVREGRWVLTGGWYIQPDCNIPSGESFARHSLYSQRYFHEKFGRIAQTGYNVDSFGHNGGLPQILKQSGMSNYVFMRPNCHEKSIPSSLFTWKGCDGSQVTTFRIFEPYNVGYPLDTEINRRQISERDQEADRQQIDAMTFYGLGNHGGGASIALLRVTDELVNANPDRWTYGSPDTYFAAQQGKSLPIVEGDLQHHAPGCYSAHSKIKADNRRAEHTLTTAEKLRCTADILFGLTYPADEFHLAWKDVMFNQFHDILGGCSLKEAYDDAAVTHGEAIAIGERQINFSLQKLSWNIDTTGGLDILRDKDKDWKLWESSALGTPVVVYNSLSWEVCAPVACGNDVKYVTDDTGAVIPSQKTRHSASNGTDIWDTIFPAVIPPMGYRVYRIFKHVDCPQISSVPPLEAGDTFMENEYLRVEISRETGMVSSLFRKDLDAELLDSAAQAIVIDETNSDTWGHGITCYNQRVGEFVCTSCVLLENGPVRSVIRTISKYGSSTLRQDFILNRGSRQVDVKVYLNWQEQHRMLKFAFPTAIENPKVMADAAYGHILRQAKGEEDPCQQWVDLFGTGGRNALGLALLNNGKYGYDADNNVLHMTALRSPIFNDHGSVRDGMYEYTDQGITKFSYAICPHAGDFTGDSLVKRAYELNDPPRVIVETFHKGPLPCHFTGIKISASHVIATAFKESEDGCGYILRCYETDGKSADTTIEIPMLNRLWSTHLKPGQIKTFYIPKSSVLHIVETNLLEWPL